MKIRVSTICDRRRGDEAAQGRETARRGGQLREDPDVERHRDAVSDDPGRHHPPALAENDREGLLGGRVHPLVRRQLDDEEAQRDGGDQRDEAVAQQPVRRLLPVQLRDRARHRHEDQEGKDAGLDGQRPDGDLLGAEDAGDGDHAAIEDREDEEGAADGPAGGGCAHCRCVTALRSRKKGLFVPP